jgi:hypothetical protein
MVTPPLIQSSDLSEWLYQNSVAARLYDKHFYSKRSHMLILGIVVVCNMVKTDVLHREVILCFNFYKSICT